MNIILIYVGAFNMFVVNKPEKNKIGPCFYRVLLFNNNFFIITKTNSHDTETCVRAISHLFKEKRPQDE